MDPPPLPCPLVEAPFGREGAVAGGGGGGGGGGGDGGGAREGSEERRAKIAEWNKARDQGPQ